MRKLRKLTVAPLTSISSPQDIDAAIGARADLYYSPVPYGVRVMTTPKGLIYAQTGKKVENEDVNTLFAMLTPGLEGWLALGDGFQTSPSTKVKTAEFLKDKTQGKPARYLRFHVYDTVTADRNFALTRPSPFPIAPSHVDFEERSRRLRDSLPTIEDEIRRGGAQLPWFKHWDNRLLFSVIPSRKIPSWKIWDRLARYEASHDGILFRSERSSYGYPTACPDSGTKTIYHIHMRKRVEAKVLAFEEKDTPLAQVFSAQNVTIRCKALGVTFDVHAIASSAPEEVAILKRGDTVLVSHDGFDERHHPKRPVIIGAMEVK